MLFLGGYIGVVQYLPTYYEQVQGMSKAAAGSMMSLVLLAYVVGSLALSTFSDQLGLRKRVYVPGMLLTSAVVFAAAVMTGAPLAAVMVAWGLSAGVVAILFVVPLELAGVGPPTREARSGSHSRRGSAAASYLRSSDRCSPPGIRSRASVLGGLLRRLRAPLLAPPGDRTAGSYVKPRLAKARFDGERLRPIPLDACPIAGYPPEALSLGMHSHRYVEPSGNCWH